MYNLSGNPLPLTARYRLLRGRDSDATYLTRWNFISKGMGGIWPVWNLLVYLAMLAGCSDGNPPTAAVTGVVRFDGKPVPHARVMFFPQGSDGSRIGFAQTDQEGVFAAVSTYGHEDGAAIGNHFVTITEGWPPDQREIPKDASGMEVSPPRGPWPARYRDSAGGALQVEVSPDQENHFEFDLTK